MLMHAVFDVFGCVLTYLCLICNVFLSFFCLFEFCVDAHHITGKVCAFFASQLSNPEGPFLIVSEEEEPGELHDGGREKLGCGVNVGGEIGGSADAGDGARDQVNNTCSIFPSRPPPQLTSQVHCTSTSNLQLLVGVDGFVTVC